MMQTTPRGYPYPECDPPLTKDASDIAHLRNLAMAVDADVQAVYDRADSVLVSPDAGRVFTSAAVASTSNTDFPFFDARTFDTTPGNAMTDITNGVMRLVRPGWYQVGGYATLTTATYLGARLRFLVDGVPATSFSTQAGITPGSAQICFSTAEVYTATGGVELSMEIRNGAALPSFTYLARLWASQGIAL